MAILKIQAGRVVQTTLNTFIGTPGTIFYDEVTGEMRLSNGTTPGGIPFGFSGSGGGTGPGGDGYTGSIGYVGSPGYVGSRGAGYTGSASTTPGYAGSQGYAGSAGTTGYVGSTGSTGYVGSTGALGYTGSRGQDGVIGRDGYTGSTGYVGSTGALGYTGSRGQDGVIGRDGYTGSTGYVGSQGYTGSSFNLSGGTLGQLLTVGSNGNLSFINPSDITTNLTAINSDILPATGGTYNLGSVTTAWNSLYVSSSTVYIGGLPVTVSTSTITIAGNQINANSNSNSSNLPIKTFNILNSFSAPLYGNAIFYPANADTIRKIQITNSQNVGGNLTAGLYKNGTFVGFFTIPAGSYTSTYNDLSIPITTADQLLVNIVSGSGINFSMALFNTNN